LRESGCLVTLSQLYESLSIHPRQPNRLVTKFAGFVALALAPGARRSKNNRGAVGRDRVCEGIVTEFPRRVANERENPNARRFACPFQIRKQPGHNRESPGK